MTLTKNTGKQLPPDNESTHCSSEGIREVTRGRPALAFVLFAMDRARFYL